jgi:hypothetical protein
MNAAQLDRRLLTYSLTAGVAVVGASAGAAILYTDLNPDEVINTGEAYDLDLNNDATRDFVIEIEQFDNPTNTAYPNTWGTSWFDNVVNCTSGGATGAYPATNINPIHIDSSFAADKAPGDVISAGLSNWSNGWPHVARGFQQYHRHMTSVYVTTATGGYMTTYSVTDKTSDFYGPWRGQGPKFLGLAVLVGGDLHYGWARCTVANNCQTVTIHDYAIQDLAGVPILAGDTGFVASAGRKMAADANDAGVPGGMFTAKPKIIGYYVDPITKKDKKASAKVLDKPTVDNPLPTVAYEWKKNVALYSKVAFKAAYKVGTVAADQPLTQTALDIDLELISKQLDAPADIPDITLNPPSITAVVDQAGDPLAVAGPEDLVVLRGCYFGAKPPKVWLENLVNGVIKTKKLKVIKPLAYPSVVGKDDASCTDPETGISELTVQMPSKWPKDWGHAEDHNLVLDNGVGIATFPFGTEAGGAP